MYVPTIGSRSEVVHEGKISVTCVPYEYQHADIFIEAVVYDVFTAHLKFLMDLSD